MNMNQIVNMVIRIFVRKAINSGIKFGIGAFAGKGGTQGQQPDDTGNASRREVQNSAAQARKMTRITRRVTRL